MSQPCVGLVKLRRSRNTISSFQACAAQFMFRRRGCLRSHPGCDRGQKELISASCPAPGERIAQSHASLWSVLRDPDVSACDLGACPLRKLDERGVKLIGGRDGCIEHDARGPVASHEIHPFRVDAGQSPEPGFLARQRSRVETDCVCMVIVHVGDGTGFGCEQRGCAPKIKDKIAAREVCGPCKSTIQVATCHIQAEKREVTEVHVKCCLGVTREKAALHSFATLPVIHTHERPQHRQARMRERVSLAMG